MKLKNLKGLRSYLATFIIGFLVGFLIISLIVSLHESRNKNESLINEIEKIKFEVIGLEVENEILKFDNEVLSSEIKSSNEIISDNDIMIGELGFQIMEMNNKLMIITNELQGYIDSVTTGVWERDIPLDYRYQEFLYRMCAEYGVDYNLMLGKISLESNFDVNAYNDSNSNGSVDVGVSQVNNVHWEDMLDIGLDVQNNVFDNIQAGIIIYKRGQKYWSELGYTGYELNVRSLNTYNRGQKGYLDYIEDGNSWDSWIYAKLVYSRMEDIK